MATIQEAAAFLARLTDTKHQIPDSALVLVRDNSGLGDLLSDITTAHNAAIQEGVRPSRRDEIVANFALAALAEGGEAADNFGNIGGRMQQQIRETFARHALIQRS